MTSQQNGRRIVPFALLPMLCCVGLPLLVGLTSITVLAWVAGSAIGVLAVAVVLIPLAFRRQRRWPVRPRIGGRG
jgi:hypothetical protein